VATALYQGSRLFNKVLPAGSDVYFEEEVDTGGYRQLRVSSAGGATTEVEPALKGKVLAGNADQILVARSDYESSNYGIFIMRPDGSNAVKILDSPVASEHAERDGVWAVVAFPGAGKTFMLYSYSATTGLKTIGCVEAANTTIHAAALTQKEVYVSIYRNEKATILRYPL
jgi:hypothetical protein